jgi:phage/plasmid-like protein (TIGR03299 family)
MASGITKRDSMFSYREVPWHGLGNVLQKRPRSVQAALREAGVPWKVEKVPVQLASRNYKHAMAEAYAAVVRQDTGDILGIVGADYELIQNHEAFELAAGIVGHGGMWETAGSLWGGKTVWALVKLPDYLEVGGDQVAQYLLVEFAHDGSRALSVYLTEVRVVCNNTLTAARSHVDAQYVYKVRHVGNTSLHIAQAREVMQLSVNYGRQFTKFGNRLARSKMSERQLLKVTTQLYEVEQGMSDRAIRSREQAREAIMHLFKEGRTVGNAPGTRWCGINAILEHYQHDQGGTRVSTQGRFLRATHDSEGFGRKALDLVIAA